MRPAWPATCSISAGVWVLEVSLPHAHKRRRRGRTDAIDAEMAARHALSLASTVEPKQTTGIVESIRQVRVAQESATNFGRGRCCSSAT